MESKSVAANFSQAFQHLRSSTIVGVSVGTTQLRRVRPHQTEITPGTKHQDTIAALDRALFVINNLDFESGMEAYIVIRARASHLREDAVD
jgi:hypothetical protein